LEFELDVFFIISFFMSSKDGAIMIYNSVKYYAISIII